MDCAWIISVPLYVAAGRANPVVSIVSPKVSACEVFRFELLIATLYTVMLLPEANGLAEVKATFAPPSTLPSTCAEPMLFAGAPLSVKAAVELEK